MQIKAKNIVKMYTIFSVKKSWNVRYISRRMEHNITVKFIKKKKRYTHIKNYIYKTPNQDKNPHSLLFIYYYTSTRR